MKIFKGYFIFLWGLVFTLIFLPIKALAFCPMCVVATGAFLGIFRWLGVDDTIIGLWLGGFILSASMVFNNLLIKKGKRIRFQLFLILLVFFGLTMLFLYQFGGLSPYNKIFGIDKIVFGIILGSSLLLLASYLDKFLRKQNEGKIFISHQKMIIAISLLIIFSLGLYFVL
ncbi:hypothetical protein L6255_02950 [Candidatus Parcubacteria bacterium]|nr:hypothetical protein [Candidatus Parcubacteria bacterium]